MYNKAAKYPTHKSAILINLINHRSFVKNVSKVIPMRAALIPVIADILMDRHGLYYDAKDGDNG